MKVLIADDERITRRSIQRQLEGWGHDVVTAEDGAEAWAQFQQQQFDIVVTDWNMPRMNGPELIKSIRGHALNSYTYLIMLTGRSEKIDLIAGMDAGADDFLSKPFDRNELRVRVSAGERIIQLERKLASQNEQLHKANDRMKRDLDAAAAMQRDLLPKKSPETSKASFAWHFQPCDELGGDILNVMPLSDSLIGLYVLDVSGHGVPAALLSVTLSHVLTTRDPQKSILFSQDADTGVTAVRSPSEVVESLNHQFPMSAQSGNFFTMAYALLDIETRILRYAIAGHPPPIQVRTGHAPRELACGSLPIGIVDDTKYENHSIQLEPGDRVYFYSDGITEAGNSQEDMLEIEGLVKLINDTQAGPLDKSVVSSIEELKRWCGPIPFADDISMLALEIQLNN